MSEQYRGAPEGSVYRNPERSAPVNLDAVIIHGKNWRRFAARQRVTNKLQRIASNIPLIGKIYEDVEPLPLKLSQDSRLAALGAVELWKAYKKAGIKPPKFIFSTGQTAGESNPTEAEKILDYAVGSLMYGKQNHPELDNPEFKSYAEQFRDDSLIEGDSYDTVGNIEKSIDIIKEEGFQDVGYVSIGYHIPRIDRLIDFYDAPIAAIIHSESLASQKSSRHKRLVENYKKSRTWSNHVLGENLLITETIFDPGQKHLSKTFAKVMRHR